MGTTAVQMSSNGNSIAFPSNTNRFVMPGCGAFLTANAVQFQGQCEWQTAGVWSKIWFRVTLNTRDGAATCRSVVNGSFGNQTATAAAATTGFFQDSSNTDTIVGGDLLGYVINSVHSTGVSIGFNISIIQSIFTATAAERVYRCVSNLQLNHGNGFIPIMGGSGTYGTAAPYQAHISGGTMRNGSIFIQSSSRNGTSTLTLNINGIDTALVVSVTSSGSGWFRDTSNTVTVFDRDKAIWNHVLGGSSGTYFATIQAVDLVTDAFFGGGSRDGAGIIIKGAGLPGQIDGVGPLTGWHEQNLTANESRSQSEALVTDNWDGVICYIDQNGQDNTCEFRARKNGSDNGHIVTITALTTGIFESTGSVVALTPTDLISLRRLTNASNPDALNYFTHNLFGAESAPTPPGAALGGIYQLVPNKTDDTVYTGFGPVTTRNIAIP